MNVVFDALCLRRMPLEYVAPAICEALFSSSAEPVIVLADVPRFFGPATLTAGENSFSWAATDGALCYNVYRADEQDAVYSLVSECVTDLTFAVTQPGCYRVSSITPEGETELSEPACF